MSNTKASAVIRERGKSELEDEQHSRLLGFGNGITLGFGNGITFKSRLLPFFLIHMVHPPLAWAFLFICNQRMLFKESNS